MMRNRLKTLLTNYPDTKTYLLFLLISIVAYWQIAFLQNSVKWDMLDCFLPWRYFVGESLQNGNLPFWNPYQHLGYPIHADLRSAWYPEMFIIGLTSGYSNITFHFLFIFYLSLAGFGMFKLSLHFVDNRKIAFITGMAYMLSGFFVGHGQDIGYLIGAVFPPWVIALYLAYLKHSNFINLLKTSLLVLLMIFGAYPSFTIFTVYFLLAIFVLHLFPILKSKRKAIIKYFSCHLLFLIIIIAGSSVLILTLPQVIPWVSRMGGLPYDMAVYNPFTPQSLLSWFVPFANISNNQFFNTDVSMNNAYWGLLMLIFFIFSFYKKKSKLEWLFLSIGTIALFASFGNYTPIHKILYSFVPGIDRFRMPSFFSLFTIITFLLIAASGIKVIYNSYSQYKKQFSRIFLFFIALMFGVFIYAVAKINFSESNIENVSILDGSSGFYAHIAIHSFIQFVILLAANIWLKNFSRKNNLLKGIAVFVFVEMLIAVQLNIYHTAVNSFDPITCRNEFKLHPKGFPVPSNKPVILNTELASKQMPLWRNVNIYSKRIGIEGFNSFVLNNYEFLFDSLPDLKNAILQNPVAYLSDNILPLSELKAKKEYSFERNDIFVDDSIYNRLKNLGLHNSPNDTVSITSFEPNEVRMEVYSELPQVLSLLQSDYIGWDAYIDNRKVPHFRSNILFRSLLIPQGKHSVTYKYNNNILRYGFILSYSVLVLLSLLIVILHFMRVYKTDRKKAFVFIITVGVLIIVFGILVIKKQLEVKNRLVDKQAMLGEIENLNNSINPDSAFICLNIMNPVEWQDVSLNHSFFRFNDEKDIAQFAKTIDTLKASTLIYANEIIPEPLAVEEFIRVKYPNLKYRKDWGNTNCRIYSNKGKDSRQVILQQELNFDKTGNYLLPDSSIISALASPSGKCFKFSNDREWGPGFETIINRNFDSQTIKISLSCDAMFNDNVVAFLVLEILRDKQQISWDKAEFQNYANNVEEWQKIFLCKIPAFKLKENDVLKVYVWNVSKSEFCIDNLKLKVN